MKSTALQNIKGREGYMPLKIDQTKVSKEKRSEAIVNIGFGRDLKPSYLEMHSPKASFLSFRTQPLCECLF